MPILNRGEWIHVRRTIPAAARGFLAVAAARTAALLTILDRYYHEHASKVASKDSARYAIGTLRKFCAEMTVADFRKKEQERIASELRERGRSEGYISRILSVARAALRRAYENEEIAAIPPFIRLARGEPRDRVLSLEEAAALFNAANGDAQFLYLLLAFGTCARPALSWISPSCRSISSAH